MTILEFLIIILIVSMLIYIHWNLLHHVRWWWLMVFNWTTWHENPVSNATLQHCAPHWLHIIQVTAHSHPHVTWPQSHEKFSTESWEPRRDARWGEATLAFARVWPLSGYKYISKQSQHAGDNGPLWGHGPGPRYPAIIAPGLIASLARRESEYLCRDFVDETTKC